MLSCILLLAACSDNATNPQDGQTARGVVKDADGHAIAMAVVQAIDTADAVLAADTTSDDGTFALSGLPDDITSIRLSVTRQDFKPFMTGLQDAAANGIEHLLVTLESDDSCCGQVVVNVSVDPSGDALSGATVWLRSGMTIVRSGETNGDGRVVFNGVCPDDYNLRISKDGYRVAERDGVNMEGCDSLSYEFALASTVNGDDSCCHGVLEFMVRDSISHDAIGGAQVRVTRVGGDARTQETNAGSARFENMCDGQYAIRIAKDGFRVQEFTVEMGCNDTMSVTRTLAAIESGGDTCCGGVAEFVIRNAASNAAISGATVRLFLGSTLLRTTTTNGDGGVRFGELCPGNYQITVIADGYRSQEYNFELGCNDVVSGTRELTPNGGDTCCSAVMKVIVRDSLSEEVISGATVVIMFNGAVVANGQTNGDGVYLEDGLCGYRTYTVTISKDGYESRTFDWTFGECRTYQETYRLTRR